MAHTTTRIDAASLLEATETALAITKLPEFRSVDEPDQTEALTFLPESGDNEESCWALVPSAGSGDEYVAVDNDVAYQLLRAHFRDWLLERGWQVQVHCYANRRRWTLVDCLSVADGGGDRLDVDYPYGEHELTVLAESVIAVNTIE